MRRELRGIWLGRRGYLPVLELQRRLQQQAIEGLGSDGAGRDVVLLLEHEPVITLGRGADARHLLASADFLAAQGISIAQSDRGGDVTLHAPGQLVAYPIIDLRPDRCDVRRYVRTLGAVMTQLLAERGIDAGYVDELVGVWVDTECIARWPGPERARRMTKLGAIGVRIARWVTMHGFALNLSTDLDLFRWIVPCGISEHGVGSMLSTVGSAPDVHAAAAAALPLLAEQLEAPGYELDDASAVADLRTLCLPPGYASRLVPHNGDVAQRAAAGEPGQIAAEPGRPQQLHDIRRAAKREAAG